MGQISAFPIEFHRRPYRRSYNTLALPCECVITQQQSTLLSSSKISSSSSSSSSSDNSFDTVYDISILKVDNTSSRRRPKVGRRLPMKIMASM